jgi:hypothetical protein
MGNWVFIFMVIGLVILAAVIYFVISQGGNRKD